MMMEAAEETVVEMVVLEGEVGEILGIEGDEMAVETAATTDSEEEIASEEIGVVAVSEAVAVEVTEMVASAVVEAVAVEVTEMVATVVAVEVVDMTEGKFW